MTKNNKMWLRGLIATVVNGFASGMVLIIADPVAFNLDAGLRKLVMTSAVFALFGLANYLKQHPLPDDEDVVTLRGLVLPLLLAASLASGCAGARAPVTPNPVDTQIQATRAKALEIAKAVESAGELTVQVTRAAIAAADAGVITRPQRDVILTAVISLEPRALAVIDVAKTVTTDPELRSTVSALADILTPLIASLQSSGSGELAKLADALNTALRIVAVYLGGGK